MNRHRWRTAPTEGQVETAIPDPRRCSWISAASCSPTGGISCPQSGATHFKLDLGEMEDRHHLTFDTYEKASSRWKNIWPGGLLRKRPFNPGSVSGFMSRNRNLIPR